MGQSGFSVIPNRFTADFVIRIVSNVVNVHTAWSGFDVRTRVRNPLVNCHCQAAKKFFEPAKTEHNTIECVQYTVIIIIII